MIRNGMICLLLWSSVSHVYSMDWLLAHATERHRQVGFGCLVLIVTGFTLKKVGNYYLLQKSTEPEVPQDIQLYYEKIRTKLNRLKVDIEYAAKPLGEFERDRIALLQEIMPDIPLDNKTEQEIHKRLMNRLCPTYTSLALAIGDVNQALLNFKKEQAEQQVLDVKGYVL